MQDLKVTLIQTDLHWEDPSANLAMLEEKIWKINEPTDLIILPEMFTTGFTMNAQTCSEPMNLTTFKWLKQQAAQSRAVVTGSYIVKEGGKYFNRLVWMQPDGSYDFYDKRHLFRMAGEHEVFSGGERRVIKVIKGWKICPLICYDLRFPVWSRNIGFSYDLLLFVANWPQARQHAWNVLLRARAIENISYVAGVNRTGADGKGIAYQGDSAIIDFKGEALFSAGMQEVISTQILSAETLEQFRKKFPAQLDADSFSLHL